MTNLIRKKVQQRSGGKRQLNEVNPHRWRRFFGTGGGATPDSSPNASPSKGPLKENDNDEVPSFIAKSFYSTKKLPFVPISQRARSLSEGDGASESSNSIFDHIVITKSPQVSLKYPDTRRSAHMRLAKRKSAGDVDENTAERENQGKTIVSPKSIQSPNSPRSAESEDQPTIRTPKRKALSPIKNIVARIMMSDSEDASRDSLFLTSRENSPIKSGGKSPDKSRVKSPQKAAILRKALPRKRRAAALPAKVQPKPKSKKSSPLSPTPAQDDHTSSKSNTSPGSRRFFKHKSPASNLKSIGGIIVGKGFDLKFVRGSSKDSKSPIMKKGTPKLKTSASKRRRVAKPGSRRSAENVSLSPLPKLSVFADQVTPTKDSSQQSSLSWSASKSPSLFVSTDEDIIQSMEESQVDNMDSQPTSDASGAFRRQLTYERVPKPASQEVAEEEEEAEDGKFYSIFSKRRHSKRLSGPGSPVTEPPKETGRQRKFVSSRSDNSQLILDAGQEKFGACQCKVCGMVYTPCDQVDEATHSQFHLQAILALKFPGWKKERVVQEYLDDGSRVIVVIPGDQRFMVKKVEEMNHVMGQELGFHDRAFSFHGSIKAFLYISDQKRVEGCCIAEYVNKGYPILPSTNSCSTVAKTACVGIGRLWVYGPSRNRGIATRLVDCVRLWFEYGICIPKSMVAFSDPTPDGRQFAAKYTGTPDFLVYKYQHWHDGSKVQKKS